MKCPQTTAYWYGENLLRLVGNFSEPLIKFIKRMIARQNNVKKRNFGQGWPYNAQPMDGRERITLSKRAF